MPCLGEVAPVSSNDDGGPHSRRLEPGELVESVDENDAILRTLRSLYRSGVERNCATRAHDACGKG